MIGIQVFNHASKSKEAGVPPFDEAEEVYWKDTCIENNYRWCTETLHLKKEGLTFIEDVWQGGGNCGACVEYFYGGLEIGNMVFTEYAVSLTGEFSPIETKVIDVGIGLERIPWLVNGGWTSYLDVFDYMLPQLSEKLGVPIDTPYFRGFSKYTALFDVDENENVQKTWEQLAKDMNLNEPSEKDPSKTKLQVFQDELHEFRDLIILCDHTRSILFAIEDGALPSNVGGCGNIRNILRRVFTIVKQRNWLDKLGGVKGIIDVFKMHVDGLHGFIKEFKNFKCLETVIELEYQRWEGGKADANRKLQAILKKNGNKLTIDDWILAIGTYGLDPGEIHEISGIPVPDDLWLKFDEYRFRTMKFLKPPEYNLAQLEPTVELFNQKDNERVYEITAKIVALVKPKIIACDRTILYATQGGQDHDDGYITIDGKDYVIEDIEKVQNIVLFHLKEEAPKDCVGKECVQHVDKEVREILRCHHTATHVIAAATRKVLGPHVWQNGAKKTKQGAHIDLTHYELPSYETLLEINRVANEMVFSHAPVHKSVYTRKEAEGTWGFVLYQGGAIPGNAIRVVDIEGLDTEACCGTHCDNLSEIGMIKIKTANKVSDGVFRIEFVAGKLALQSLNEDMQLIHNLELLYRVNKDSLEKNCQRFFTQRNTFETQVKKLSLETLGLQLDLALSTNDEKLIIYRNDTDAKNYYNGLEKMIGDRVENNTFNKSVMIFGKGFLFGLIPAAETNKYKDAFKELADKKEVLAPKAENSKVLSNVGKFGYFKVQDTATAQVLKILLELGYKEMNK
ncbi:alanyl-tRNA synthetase family protein [Tritrichomonas foetus]|uniref:Alanine--tRNA ligase n=1 Tax=Tritrichomonas foetus TaxID=1144522 RepID=A0A1J4J9U7_9EUKA|nr:alanyl-tRNA synthetase family protein [Tritrichomonas foetus]|eukprot:OHS94213.1 alanyl-tRNA synthetase family protein [Tritrichomonas foetus]